METKRTPLIGYAVWLMVAAIVLLFVLRLSQGEVAFCRNVFRNLVNGSQSAQRHIDWEHLKAVGVDVGKTYTELPNDQARAQYRKAFVSNFAMGFRRTEGNLGAFRRWRVQGRDGDRIVVAADYETKQTTLLLSIPASGKKQLEAIQWQ